MYVVGFQNPNNIWIEYHHITETIIYNIVHGTTRNVCNKLMFRVITTHDFPNYVIGPSAPYNQYL